jgi:hypothetical protein
VALALAILLVAFGSGCVSGDGTGDESPAVTDEGGGKADMFGNRGEGEECSWDWHCSSDLELVCRPISPEQHNTRTCQPLADIGGSCDSDWDCVSETTCERWPCVLRCRNYPDPNWTCQLVEHLNY